MKLYSYVVDHDTGYAPNPFEKLCTLACCKFSETGKRRNLVELAEEGTWIVGIGGADKKKSSGHGTLVYAMQVTEKIPFAEYCGSYGDRHDGRKPSPAQPWRYALISKKFYYFGRNAVQIPKHLFEKIKLGRGFRNRFSEAFIQEFVTWIKTHRRGRHGLPCIWPKDSAEPKTDLCKHLNKQRYGF